MKLWPWLYPGSGVKRWLGVAGLGIIVVGMSLAIIFQGSILGYFEERARVISLQFLGNYGRTFGGLVLFLWGLLLMFFGFRQAVRNFLRAAFPEYLHNPMKSVYERQYLRKGPRIVVLGGGTGLSVLLRGLKEYTSNITAIVSVTDDGGSSGRLRGQFGILPPGDLRNCLVALADTEPAMEKLFDYRFSKGSELAGHNLGNLLITAMAEMSDDFETAIHEIGKVLAIRGRVVPATLDNITLAAELQDGTVVMGETNISRSVKPIKRVFTVPALSKTVSQAIEAIMEADAIILGPGSLYTSVIPNLLVQGISEAVQKAEGLKIYVCNVMTQPGETKGYSASAHLKAIYRHTTPGLMDYVIVNNQDIPVPYRERYHQEGAEPVAIDQAKLEGLNVKIIAAPLLQEMGYIRHHPHKLAYVIIKLILDNKEPQLFPSIIDHYLLSEKLLKTKRSKEIKF